MEFWTRHHLGGSGAPDIYIRHKLPRDPTGFTGLFLLLFISLFLVSFLLLGCFSDKDGSGLMGIGMLTILGSAGVAALFAARLCGLAHYSYVVPFGALGGFFVLCLVVVGVSCRAAEEKRQVAAEEFDRSAKITEKYGQILDRGKLIVEQAKQALVRSGWAIKDSWADLPWPQDPNHWHDAAEVPEQAMTFYVRAEPPSPKDITIEIRYYQNEQKSMIQAYGSDATNVITQASEDAEVKKDFIGDLRVEGYQYHSLKDETNIQKLGQGRLRQLCSELESAFKAAVAHQRAADQQTTEQQAAYAKANQPKAESSGAWFRWAVGAIILSVIGGVGVFVGRKQKEKAKAPLAGIPTVCSGKKVQIKSAVSPKYRFVCSACHARYKVGDDMLGKRFRCKKCVAICIFPLDSDQLTAE